MSKQLNVILEFYRNNDRMIETVERINDSYLEALDALEKLEAENTKLRELLSEIAKLVTNPYGGCLRPGCAHGCPHHLECDEELHTCFYVDRMRELGVDG